MDAKNDPQTDEGNPGGEPPVPAPAPPTIEPTTSKEKALVQLKLIFDSIDKDASDSICKVELTSALETDSNRDKLGSLIKDAELNPGYNLMKDLDTDNNGRITWEEFSKHLEAAAVKEVEADGVVAAAEIPADQKVEKQLRSIFESLDADADDTISQEELVAALNKDPGLSDLVKEAGFNSQFNVMEHVNTDKTARITWREFEEHLRASAKQEVMGEVAHVKPVEIEIHDENQSKCNCC